MPLIFPFVEWVLVSFNFIKNPRREKYSNVLQTVIVGRVRILVFLFRYS